MQGKDAPSEKELLISQREFVGSVMASKKLYQLKCFGDSSEEQALKDTLGNLDITQNPAEPLIYDVTFSCLRPTDAQKILGELISSYKEELTKTKVSSVADPELDSDPQAEPKNAAAVEFVKRLRSENDEPAYELLVFDPASNGEPIRIFSWFIWAVTGLIGFLVGVAIIASIFMFSRSMGKPQL